MAQTFAEDLIERALQNLARAIDQLKSLGEEDRKVYAIGGEGFTLAQVRDMIVARDHRAIDHVAIWAMSEEKVFDEIRKAKARRQPL